MNLIKYSYFALLFAFATPLLVAEVFSDVKQPEVIHIEVEPATTTVEERVMIKKITAKVIISFKDLKLRGSQITGQYATKIDASDTPLLFRKAAKKKAETGYVELNTDNTYSEIKESGGVFKGKGVCPDRNNEERIITCSLIPDEGNPYAGTADLEVDSGKRLLKFKSRYRVTNPELSGVRVVMAD